MEHEYDPYAYRFPHSLTWHGSVIPRVLPETAICLIVAVTVTCIDKLTNINIAMPNQMLITVIGFVVALLLTYRTNTAYDRYWEGRRLWSNLTVAVRNTARTIWISIREENTTIILEKKTAINLLAGFAVATKHYLREEDGCDYDDLRPLISNIRSTLPGFEPLEDQDRVSELVRLGAGPNTINKMFKRQRKPHERKKGELVPLNHNLPLEILLYLASYFAAQSNANRISAPTSAALGNGLAQLTDCLTHFERILRSPIPVAYAIHLSQTVWIYCLSLPFQFVAPLGWATIPLVFIASFVLLGIEKIGGEIENPFGYDENDLDLEDFCNLIVRELDTITANPPPSVDDWIFAPENHPFGPQNVTAEEARKLSVEDVRVLLDTSAQEKRNSSEIRDSTEIKIETK